MTVPSIGDILMLSQKAWKIGRAFAACQKQAPPDLGFIEVEIGGLAKALTLLAETLYAECESDLFQNADQDIRTGIATIIKSCQRAVDDLDSLVDQYQVIKKHRTLGGFAIERAWSDVILAKYKTISWTTDGGDLNHLRDLLQVHTNSITALMQALQSKSSTRLDSVVKPMAQRIDSMYNSSSSLDRQLDEVHRMVQDLDLTSQDSSIPPLPPKHPGRLPSIGESSHQDTSLDSHDLPASPSRSPNFRFSFHSSSRHPRSSEHSIAGSDNGPSTPLRTRDSVSESSLRDPSVRYSSSSYASSDAGKSSAGWQSPQPLTKPSNFSRRPSMSTKATAASPESRQQNQRPNTRHSMLLQPPAMGLEVPFGLERTLSQAEMEKLCRSSTTTSQRNTFEKEAFRNSAILCDVRGKAVEYSHRINQDDPRDVEMITVCGESRIAVVRKRITDPETRIVRVVTSIWVFSDDNQVRMELRMHDEHMYIPYASYFSPAKVSITVPCELRFYDVAHSAGPASTAQTSWVNYVFDSPRASALFQNELMGRTLLATFRTEKTLRIHSGLSKSFAYAEQMCGLETLRVWQDNDTGAVIALIHFSADFRPGYLAFYLNSSNTPITVKDDGSRQVKIRGLRVSIDGPAGGNSGSSGGTGASGAAAGTTTTTTTASSSSSSNSSGKKKSSDKDDRVISGAKIEFATDMEKREFLDMCKAMQAELMELPELKGVN